MSESVASVALKTANRLVSTNKGLRRASTGFSEVTAKQKRKTQWSLPSISEDTWPAEVCNYDDCKSKQDACPGEIDPTAPYVDPTAPSDFSLDTLDMVNLEPALWGVTHLKSRSDPFPSCPRYPSLPPRRCSAITNHLFSRRGASLRSWDLEMSDQRAFPPSFHAVDF